MPLSSHVRASATHCSQVTPSCPSIIRATRTSEFCTHRAQSSHSVRSKPPYSWIEPKIVWTILVLLTVSLHVPWGSLFRRFFWLYFEYVFTTDFPRRAEPATDPPSRGPQERVFVLHRVECPLPSG